MLMNKKMWAAALTVLALGACATTPMPTTVSETVAATPQLSTLNKLLGDAGLTETLKQEGPYTVFAPTDEAFKKLGEETIKKVLADKELLKKILLAHVVEGSVMAEEVVKLDGKEVKTIQGTKFMVSTKDGVKLGEAKVVKTDIKCSNGVIHVIDTVLMPAKE